MQTLKELQKKNKFLQFWKLFGIVFQILFSGDIFGLFIWVFGKILKSCLEYKIKFLNFKRVI